MTMRVSEWMTPAPVAVSPETPIPKVQQLMAYRRIRHLPVVEGDHLIGIITDRDLRTVQPSPATSLSVREVQFLLDRLTVRAVMTRPVLTVAPHESLAEAVRLMLENRIGGLPVTEGERLVGILTAVDLLRAFSSTLGVPTGRPPRAADAPLHMGSPDRVILVPLDGASGSEAVLDAIGELARAEGASVRLLSVQHPVHEVESGGRILAYADQERERVEAEARTYLQRVAASLGSVTVSFAVRFGEPANQIVEEAEAARVTLIAMATHHRTGIARILKGSVAERVERTTAIPVMLVQYGSDSAREESSR
jgi:acetoin utilization protein AcuB